VYCVLGSSGKKGLVLTVLPLTVIVPGITAPPTVSTNVKVAAFNVEVAIASEKVAETEELVAMPVAAFAGEVAETVGGVESADAPVVKLQTKSDVSALPDESFAAVLTVAEYCVFGTRLEEGANIATLPLTATTPAIGGPPAVGSKVRAADVKVETAIASENVAVTNEFNATSVSAFDGDVSRIVGGVVSRADSGVEEASPGEPSELLPPPPPHPEMQMAITRKAIRTMRSTRSNLFFSQFDIWLFRNEYS
jgi:hypothetical protein